MTRGEILRERIGLLASRLAAAEGPDLGVITANLATRGLAASGAMISERHKRRLRTVRELLAERIRLEKALPLAPGDEETWLADLQASVYRITDDQASRLFAELEADCGRFLGGNSEPFKAEVTEELKRLRSEYLREAEIMKGEREHQKKVSPSAPPPNIVLKHQSQSGGWIERGRSR